ncbi:zinc transporter ZIP10-like [Mizuhopecten yessoensis]|uniref:zinc transporter ZIP10-like n=1 Tax=Mizuhopecten yessoensis TaxID=6573 RepID=UPI000B457E2C|nr:zinc transporter ZIP10-like [Mizuhopecten yessoensis]
MPNDTSSDHDHHNHEETSKVTNLEDHDHHDHEETSKETNLQDHDHHDHEEMSKVTNLRDELLNAQNLYVTYLIDRFGYNGVLNYDSIIHMLESLGINLKVPANHSHTEHSHQITDSHAGHSHDADHSEQIHDSDHEKHNPETDHEDRHHDGSDHENHDHDSDHENHDHDSDHENHDHDSDHKNHDHDSDHKNHDHYSDHENHDGHQDHHHTHSNNTSVGSHKLLNNSDHDVRRRRSSSLVRRQKRKIQNESEDSHNHLEGGVESQANNEKCDDLISRFHIHRDETVTTNRLLQMCPGILFTLSRAECRKKVTDHQAHPVKQAITIAFTDIPAEVWGYSTIAVVVISLVGLLGVAVVPIMQKVFYNHLLLFLVALAVGALAGDALLHLLPHVSNNINIKGSVFLKESGDLADDNTSIPLTECGAMHVTDPDCKEQIMGIHPGQKALTNFAESSHKNCSRDHEDQNDKDKQFDMVDQENPSSVLSHSHHNHGHSHILPTSVASIAWMVILGDGIHNLCDGLAIGAAFSNSITGGFSTSLAVFCHELPHEIGDFAVLLRAGMTVKQAVMYNCVSSILALVGMIIGVAIGNFGDSITWVFVSVAGMFLYIALVDMLPELTAMDTRQGEHPFSHLLIQLGGMILGTTIMLIIALYEKNLMNILEPV